MATVPYSLTVNGNLLKTSMTGTDLATSELKCRTPYMYFAGACAGAGTGTGTGTGTAVQVQVQVQVQATFIKPVPTLHRYLP
jgi:hypothetical protein